MIASVVALRWRASFIVRVISGCGRPADRPITSVCSSIRPSRPSASCDGLADDLGAQVEQHQQVAQVAGEERHLVGARDQHLLGRRRSRRSRPRPRERESLRAVSSTLTWSAASAASNSFWSSENSGAGTAPAVAAAVAAAAVLVARGLLELGEALEAERLREAHDGRGRRVGAAGELLGGLERGLVEVVDDVLRDVLLRARELVEARLDVGGQGLVAVGSSLGAAVELEACFMGRPLIRRLPVAFLQRPRLRCISSRSGGENPNRS